MGKKENKDDTFYEWSNELSHWHLYILSNFKTIHWLFIRCPCYYCKKNKKAKDITWNVSSAVLSILTTLCDLVLSM